MAVNKAKCTRCGRRTDTFLRVASVRTQVVHGAVCTTCYSYLMEETKPCDLDDRLEQPSVKATEKPATNTDQQTGNRQLTHIGSYTGYGTKSSEYNNYTGYRGSHYWLEKIKSYILEDNDGQHEAVDSSLPDGPGDNKIYY